MSFSLQELDHLLALSHLHLEDSEKPHYLAQLQRILDHMKNLSSVNLDGLSAELSTTQSTPLRDDVVVTQPDLLLKQNAPLWEAGCFRVPRLLE